VIINGYAVLTKTAAVAVANLRVAVRKQAVTIQACTGTTPMTISIRLRVRYLVVLLCIVQHTMSISHMRTASGSAKSVM
jgi:hypothetical protein